MPNKVSFFFIIFISTLSYLPDLQAVDKQILLADNLFAQGNYTEALAIYEHFFEKKQQSSPQILLKMAFIHEGLEQYAEALYYLSLHYRQNPSFESLSHMEALARKESFKGYEYSEIDFFRAFYHRYFEEISIGLFLFGLLSFLLLLYAHGRAWKVPRYYAVLLLFFLSISFILIVFTKQPPRAIIYKDQSYLLTAPSAAADVARIINKGHKIKILGKQDVWYKFNWSGQIVYIHQENLKLIL